MGRETGEETRSIWMATPLPRFAALAWRSAGGRGGHRRRHHRHHHRLVVEAAGPARGGDRGSRGWQRRDLAHQRASDGGAGRGAVAPGVPLRRGTTPSWPCEPIRRRSTGSTPPPARWASTATSGGCRASSTAMTRSAARMGRTAGRCWMPRLEAAHDAGAGGAPGAQRAAAVSHRSGPAVREPGAVPSPPLPARAGGRPGQRRQRGVRAHPGAVGRGRRALPGGDRTGHGDRRTRWWWLPTCR